MLNMQRFKQDFCEIAQYGILSNGGVTRLAFTKADHDARNYLIQQMRQAGLAVTVDPVGNIRGRRVGTSDDLAPVMIGSHLDTVPQGGHYDGVIGVLTALELVRTLNDHTMETLRPIEIINFAAEESSRFGMATIGSKALTGKLSVEKLKTLHDSRGESLLQVLKNSGCSIEDLPMSVLGQDALHAYLELHIEQGPILETEQLDIGIVTAIAAPSRFHVEVRGRSDHSGTTPMSMRRDALAGAAELVLAVERLAVEESGDMVATVGELCVAHGAMNVVPGCVTLSIDIRDTCFATKQEAIDQLKLIAKEIAAKRRLDINFSTLCNDRPVAMDKKISEIISDGAQKLNLHCKLMPSGAGHDAMHLADITPSGLIFIPSIKGVSHNIEEKSSLESIKNGGELLFETAVYLANDK